MIYWILLILLGVLYPISLKKIKIGTNQTPVKSKYNNGKIVYLVLVALILILFVGLRSIDVGADTITYKKIFDWAKDYPSFYLGFISWQSGGVEPLFYFITYIFAHFLNFQYYLIFLAIISILPIIIVIGKYSNNIYFSLFLYISFGYFSFALSGLRQAAAIGICMIAFDAAIEKKIKKFFITVIIAILFHKTAFLFLPVYWLINIKKGRYNIVLFGGLLITVFALRSRLYSILNLFARQSYEIASTDQGGYRMFLVMLFTVIIGWIYYYKFIRINSESDNNLSWLLLQMISVSALMWPIANLNAELNRMYYYYHIFIVLYIPNLIKSINRKNRILFIFLFMIISCYYLESYIIGGNLKYYPYIPFWE